MTTTVSRRIENWLAVLGGVIAAAYVVAIEILPTVLYSMGKTTVAPTGHEFPWGVVILVGALVLPKTVGRATAGKVWDAIAGRGGK